MTNDTPIHLDCSGPVAHLRFNRPDTLNAIDEAMARAFHAAMQTVATTESVRCVVVSGTGRAFMAGGDLGKFRQALPRASDCAHAIIGPLHRGLVLMAELSRPVIASVHGAVAGAGMSLALACDFVIAADDTRFNLAYPRIGTSLDGGASWSLPRLVGVRKALEIALLADPISAADALALGLVNRVVPAATREAETDMLAARLAAGPTCAYGRIKRLIRTSLDHDLRSQLGAEQEAFAACAETADFAEGLDAFFGKRAADFRGR